MKSCREELWFEITASVFINDDESGLHADYERWLQHLPEEEEVRSYGFRAFLQSM